MNYTIEYTTGAWNTPFKHWTTASMLGCGIYANTLADARKMLCNWIRANISDEGDYDVEGLCATAMTLDAGGLIYLSEFEGFAHNYTLRIKEIRA